MLHVKRELIRDDVKLMRIRTCDILRVTSFFPWLHSPAWALASSTKSS
jgi:hypothetical protein